MYRIAIPSFQRPNIFKNRALNCIKSYNIPLSIIDLFLENEEQYDLYHKELGNEMNEFGNVILTKTEGVGAKRNAIRKYYHDKKKLINVVQMDDDVESFNDMEGKLLDLHQFIHDAFVYTGEQKLNLWGIISHDNKFYKKHSVTTNLKYVPGVFYGLIIDPEKELLQTNYNHYEDMWFNVMHFIRDKGIIRYNYVNAKSKYFEKGGIEASYGGIENRKKDMEVASIRFVDEFRGLCTRKINKWGWSINLNFRAKPELHNFEDYKKLNSV